MTINDDQPEIHFTRNQNQDPLLDKDQDPQRQSLIRAQRIVLIAEEFDYALLVGTEWLSNNYSVDVMCCRISVAKDVGSGTEYLVCSNVYNAGGLSPPDKPEPTFSSMVGMDDRERLCRIGIKI